MHGLAVDKPPIIAEIPVTSAVQITLDLPAGVFDANFPAAQFVARVREFAVLELLRARRLHEHEAERLLELDRWELAARMQAAGITPVAQEFEQITSELERIVAAQRGGGPDSSGQSRR